MQNNLKPFQKELDEAIAILNETKGKIAALNEMRSRLDNKGLLSDEIKAALLEYVEEIKS